MMDAPETIEVNGSVWTKHYLDDRSGCWFELKGKFGDLIVEEERDGTFVALWWPPKIDSGEPVRIKAGYKTMRGAMKAGVAYIQDLGKSLGVTQVVGLPC